MRRNEVEIYFPCVYCHDIIRGSSVWQATFGSISNCLQYQASINLPLCFYYHPIAPSSTARLSFDQHLHQDPTMSQSYARQSFHSSSAPAPNGNYSHAILQQSSAILHVAGWMGDDPQTGKIVEGGIGAQTVSTALVHLASYLLHRNHQKQYLVSIQLRSHPATLPEADTGTASSNAQHPILPPSRRVKSREDHAPENLHHRHQAVPRSRCDLGGVGRATVSGEHLCAGKPAAFILSVLRSGIAMERILLLTLWRSI